MDKPSIVLSGSAVFHGDVNLHFHSHAEPTRKRKYRNDDCGITQMPIMELSSGKFFVSSEKPAENDEAIPEYSGNIPELQHCNKEFYDRHIENDSYYQITHRPKGLVVIINNEFRSEKGWRKGAAKDVDDLVQLWKRMGCKVISKENIATENMMNVVESAVSNIDDADFFVAIIMSHGDKEDFIYGADKCKMQVKQIVDSIARSERLQNKPKLIFFQMCRGEKVERDQIEVSESDGHDQESEHVGSGTPSIVQDRQDRPFRDEYSDWVNKLLNNILEGGRRLGSGVDEPEAFASEYTFQLPDVLLAFATQPDHVAFRNTKRGSWFIQSMTRVFAKYAATTDVIEMMEIVQKEMSKEIVYSPGRPSIHEGRATVDGSDTFGSKRLFLFPGFPKK